MLQITAPPRKGEKALMEFSAAHSPAINKGLLHTVTVEPVLQGRGVRG